jgi:hypothetical protein
MKNYKTIQAILVALAMVGMAWLASPVSAAILTLEYDFGTGAQGWTEIGPATFDSTGGDLDMTFAAQVGEPLPETSSFVSPVINLAQPYTLTQFAFNFSWSLASPSALLLTFGNDNFSVSRALTPVNGLTTVSLASAAGWNDPLSQFNNLVSDFNFVELSVSRSGTAEQTYSMDDFIISYIDALVPPENLSAVPEPTTISMLLFVLTLAVVARRYRQAATVPA